MTFIFLMDPLETVVMEKDTSFILMLGAHRKGHKCVFVPDGGMVMEDGALTFYGQEVTPQQDAQRPFIDKRSVTLSESDVSAVFIRRDPPFNESYLMNTWFLDHLSEKIPVINRPSGLRRVNEKVWAARFPQLVPPTLVGRDKESLLKFLAKHQNIVAKPTDGYGGMGVFLISAGDSNNHVILETLSDNYSKDIILQKQVPQAKEGDKRILLLDGQPLGAVLRVHGDDDHRNNFFSGGQPHPVEITARDQEIINELKPFLQKLGLYFVGIDIIGDYLIEVNVTSPTCLQEMNKLGVASLEDQVIVFVEKKVEEFCDGRKITV